MQLPFKDIVLRRACCVSQKGTYLLGYTLVPHNGGCPSRTEDTSMQLARLLLLQSEQHLSRQRRERWQQLTPQDETPEKPANHGYQQRRMYKKESI